VIAVTFLIVIGFSFLPHGRYYNPELMTGLVN